MSDHNDWCRPRLVTRPAPGRSVRGGRLRLLAPTDAKPESARQVAEEQELRALILKLKERAPARSADHDDGYPPAAA